MDPPVRTRWITREDGPGLPVDQIAYPDEPEEQRVVLVLTFGVVLLVTVALSGLAARSVLSTALVFLVAGALVGPGFLGLIEVSPGGPLVSRLADLALFTVLFVDGGRLSVRELRAGWRLSGRALVLGMPLSLVLVAVAAHYLVGLDWITALLVGAILSPTDPVFASAIVGRSEVPLRLRRLLNIESGVNDGLALPFVLVFLAMASGAETGLGEVALELVLGVVFGVGLTLVVTALFRLPLLGSEPKLQPLGPLALAITLYGLCHYTHANAYLAAFSAGITLATIAPRASHAFEGFGELISELTKFAPSSSSVPCSPPPSSPAPRRASGSSPCSPCCWSAPSRSSSRSGAPGCRAASSTPPPGSARKASPPSSTACSPPSPGFRTPRPSSSSPRWR